MELLNYALNPANEFVMEELFNAGFESGERSVVSGACSEAIIALPIHCDNLLYEVKSMFTKVVRACVV